MKSLTLGLLFLSTCHSQFIYPNVNEILYADNTYNISWNSSNSELYNQNDLHIFLTNYIDNIHNNLTISNYNNGTPILDSYIGNESNYEWNIPYELNKYNIHLHNFKLLLSNTSTPFIYTLGNPNFLYYYSDYFKIYSNLSISHPEYHEIVTPNTSYLAYHGFQNNLSVSFLYYSPFAGSYIPVPNLIYDVEPSDSPYYFEYKELHPYSQYQLQAKIVESISHIELSSANFYLMGINITAPSTLYLNPSHILLTWNNYNYNGTNTIYIYYQNSLYDTIVINETEYNLDVLAYNSGIYNITITNDLYPYQISQNILLNILFSTTTTTATDTTTTVTTATDTTATDTTTTVTTATDTTTTDTSFNTFTTTLGCVNCTGNIGHDDDSDGFNYLYIILIVGGCILIILLAYCIDRKCKQIKLKHEENKVSPQDGIKMNTITYRTTYDGTEFVDYNSHEYNHLNRSRVIVNENYQNNDNTSNNSSISYHVQTYSNSNSNHYDEAIPASKTTGFY